MKLFSLFDSKAGAFNRPFAAPSESFAIRLFADQVNKGDDTIKSHPGDFDLFVVASFDEETGIVNPDKRQLINGAECREG